MATIDKSCRSELDRFFRVGLWIGDVRRLKMVAMFMTKSFRLDLARLGNVGDDDDVGIDDDDVHIGIGDNIVDICIDDDEVHVSKLATCCR